MAEYIEREDALTKLEDIGFYDDEPIQTRNRALKIIKNIPSADVRPVVHGHWIWKHRHRGGFKKVSGVDAYGNEHTIIIDDRYEIDDPYCSGCGILNDSFSLNFCPNCGAIMREGEFDIGT